MTNALRTKESEPTATVTDALLAACATALRAHPALNAHYADEVVTSFDAVHLGVAVATEAGLMVPVIHGADGLRLTDWPPRARTSWPGPGPAHWPWPTSAAARSPCPIWA